MDNFGIMEDVFISNIKINKVRHLENLEIPLSGEERKHLILTGKNGSGKTSVLLALKSIIADIENPKKKLEDSFLGKLLSFQSNLAQVNSRLSKNDENQEEALLDWKNRIEESLKTQSSKEPAYFLLDDVQKFFRLLHENKFVFAFFPSNRVAEFKLPLGPKKLNVRKYYSIEERASQGFMQYMVNLRFNYLNAAFNHNTAVASNIDSWVGKFESCLKQIFDDPGLKLQFDSDNFKYDIVLTNNEVFNLSILSDGFSRAIDIITELMMRMENNSSAFYNLQGIVLIDEIETHLHIDLQKKILPFLTSFFPKIQFIVTTHSPFVLTSIKDAIVYDLEHQEAIEDLSGYSVEAIIEGYFGSDKYSEALKAKVDEYEQLAKKDELSYSEEERYQSLKKYFDDLSDVFADELKLKIQQIKLLNPVK